MEIKQLQRRCPQRNYYPVLHLPEHVVDVDMLAMRTMTTCNSHDGYIETIGRVLYSSLCLRDFPCQDVERRNKPEIEFGECPELLLQPHNIVLRGAEEKCLIEPSINSTRISFLFSQGDDLDGLLATSMYKFLGMKADHHLLLRRSPVDSYNISFLVTSELLQQHGPINIILSILKFAVDIPEFLSDLKSKVILRLEDNVRQSVYILSCLLMYFFYLKQHIVDNALLAGPVIFGFTLGFTQHFQDNCLLLLVQMQWQLFLYPLHTSVGAFSPTGSLWIRLRHRWLVIVVSTGPWLVSMSVSSRHVYKELVRYFYSSGGTHTSGLVCVQYIQDQCKPCTFSVQT